jgi:hypothetical protein
MGQDLALSHTQDMLFINRKDTSKEELWERSYLFFVPKILLLAVHSLYGYIKLLLRNYPY